MIRTAAMLWVALCLCAVSPSAHASTTVDAILSQKTPLGREDLERIYQFKLDRGAANLSVASCFLIRASKRFLQDGNGETARAYAEYAVKIAPDYPPAYTNLAAVCWAENRFKIDKLCEGLYKYLYATVTNYVPAAVPLTRMLFVVMYALLLTIAVYSLISLYKYFKLFAHDLGHLLPALLPRHFTVCCAVIIFALPLCLKWSIFFASFYWLLLLFLYHNRREQQLIIIFALFFSLSPFMMQTLSQLMVASSSGTAYYTSQVNEENWGEDTARMLAQQVEEHPYDADALFSLALLNKREGRIKEAQRLYAALLELEPFNCRAWCNLGNAHAAEKKLDVAISNYGRALELCPDSVEGYYNLSRIQLLEYMFSESNKSFSKAKQLGADRVDSFLNMYSTHMNRQVVDQTITTAERWQKTFTASKEKDRLCAHLWGGFFSGIAYKYRYGTFLVFLLFVILLFADRHSQSRSMACEYCGCAVCRKCKRLLAEYKLCKQCAGIFKNASDIMISISKKESQVASIERYQGRRIFIGKLLSLLMPGSGHLLFDQPFRGTAVLFLFLLLIAKLFLWNRLAVNPWQLISGSAYLDVLVIAIPLCILYLYSLGHFNFSSMKLFQFLSLIRVTRRELQTKE